MERTDKKIKMKQLLLFLCLLWTMAIQAQVKIGERPEVIDPTSLLELESTTKVLVITRATTDQMDDITPLRGAMVYNTDTDCVHYFNGTAWINLCDTAADALSFISSNKTIGITQTDNVFDLKVNRVHADSIISPSTIRGNHIGNNSIGINKLAAGTTNGQLIQWDGYLKEWILVQDITTIGNINGQDITAAGQFYSNNTTIATIPDYVFQKYFNGRSGLNAGYRFQTLDEIEAFVRKNHHLPGIKSAAQVKEDGYWNLSASNLQNLEKIEELFLHAIEQEKKIRELRSENESLSTELKSIKKDLEEIRSLLKNR